MKSRRLSYTLAAEALDVDLSGDLTADSVKDIRGLWLENHILLFRNQKLSPEQQISFSKRLGELEVHPVSRLRSDDNPYPEIFEVTNRQKGGKPSPSAYIGDAWHTDGAFTTRPAAGSLLYCLESPDVGGDTWFANLYFAYDTLSPKMKSIVEELESVQDARMDLEQKNPLQAAKDEKDVPPVVQPLVRVHPETGRKALYVNPHLTRKIYGMSDEEGKALLSFLVKHATRPEFTYRHQWRVGDLIIWDNRCTLHLAAQDYDRTKIRHMHRTTLVGTPSGRFYDPQAELTALS